MEKDIDFMAEVDESTSPELVFKMLLVAQRDKLKSLQRESILSNQFALLSNENALLKIKLFGKSSEKVKPDANAASSNHKPDLQAFDEAKTKPQDIDSDLPIDTKSTTLKIALNQVESLPKEPKKRGRKPIPNCYQRIDVIHDLQDDQKQCACGCDLKKIGEEVSEQLDVIPSQIYVKRHIRFKYACKNCQENVKIAPVQNQAIPKTLAAPGLLSHVAVMKFDDHLPLYRQSEIWNRMGVDLSRSTLSAWVLKMGNALEPIRNYLQKHIIASGYVQADETVCQVMKTPGKSDQSNSYMWVYMTGNDTKSAVVYDYREGRRGDFAKEFLGDFKGVLQTDGYSGYKCISEQFGVIAQGCMAHARRKFYDVWKLSKQEGVASNALEVIGKLYDIEDQIKELSIKAKQQIRYEQAKPILDEFHIWLTNIKPKVQAKGILDKAIQYTLNQWKTLTYYVNNGAIAIDNNAAERQIKPFVIGRKNWLFMGSPDGAKAASTLYTLIETAKLNDVNPEGYLKFLLEQKLEQKVDENNIELLESLMPWNAKIENGYTRPSLKPSEPNQMNLEQIKSELHKNTS